MQKPCMHRLRSRVNITFRSSNSYRTSNWCSSGMSLTPIASLFPTWISLSHSPSKVHFAFFCRVDRMCDKDEFRCLPTLREALNTCVVRTGSYRPISTVTFDRPLLQSALFKCLRVMTSVKFSASQFNCFWFTGTLLNFIILKFDCDLSERAKMAFFAQATKGLMSEKSLKWLKVMSPKFWGAISREHFALEISLRMNSVLRNNYNREFLS